MRDYWCGAEYFPFFSQIFLIAVWWTLNSIFGLDSRTFANKVATSFLFSRTASKYPSLAPNKIHKFHGIIMIANSGIRFFFPLTAFCCFFYFKPRKKWNRFPRTKNPLHWREKQYFRESWNGWNLWKIILMLGLCRFVQIVIVVLKVICYLRSRTEHGARLRLHVTLNYSIFRFWPIRKIVDSAYRKLMYISKWNFRRNLCAFIFSPDIYTHTRHSFA